MSFSRFGSSNKTAVNERRLAIRNSQLWALLPLSCGVSPATGYFSVFAGINQYLYEVPEGNALFYILNYQWKY